MKQEQQTQARRLYFQTNLSKTEIAETLSVDRRTIYQWSVDGDWEKLRTSARTMPSILAEKCYYLIGHFTDHLLSKESCHQSVTKADADILYKLTRIINLLKKGSTINENMETFTWFLEGLHKRDAQLAEAVAPYADTFISSRAATTPSDFVMNGYTRQGFKPFSEKDITEKWRDEQDAEAILDEIRKTQSNNTNNTSAVETECIPSLHNTDQNKTDQNNPDQRNNTSAVETECIPSLHNTDQNNPATNNTSVENPQPTQSNPAPATTPTKADKAKARQARFNEQKARKEARKNGKAA